MKFTRSWLAAHLDTDADLTTIAETLTRIGLELEGIEDRAAALAPFRIARVISAVPHPDADRLRACMVDAGDGVPVSVVCGAPNARTGMMAVFAPPGSFIPGTGITLKTGRIRGVESAGMLLSAREMGLGEDHSGIVDLPEDAPLGASYAAWAGLDDAVIEISVTPNRGDALGVRGIARDLAAAGIGRLKPFAPAPVAPAYPSPITWKIAAPEACPFVLGRAVRGLKNGESPRWLRERLTAIGLRPINALVDITNYFTFDLGRPLHVFDVAKLSGPTLTLRPGANETMRALNGRDYVLGAEDCVIADAAGVQSLAGVMGGEASGCTADTTEVFVECALFDPVRVALSGRRHQITSDARQRFERGIDAALMPDALEAATAMILELCGGEASAVAAAGAMPARARDARLRFSRLAELGGAAIAPDTAVASLAALGFSQVARDADSVTVAVPSWRNDVAAPIALDQAPGLDPARAVAAAEGCAAIEAECDLVEEVLRIAGLDAIPPVSLPVLAPVPPASLTEAQSRTARVRRVLAAQGLVECVTFSFMDRTRAAYFGETPAALTLLNPIAADLDQLRPGPLATLALAASRNGARGYADAALFEIGPGFVAAPEASQRAIAAGLRSGATPRAWNAPARPVGMFDAKADLFAALAVLGVPMEALSVTADAPSCFHPGRSGVVRQGPKAVLGVFGELHPSVLAALGMAGPAAGFELFLDAVALPKKRRRAAPVLSAFQPVRRDFAFVVDATVPAEALLRAARGAERTLIAGVVLFDRFAGGALGAGKVSLGIEVTFQPVAATLTEAEIEAASAKVVAAVAKATGAVLR
ncbi:MAG: phenylalanine--tRNA ligase subunit beta [Rhodospirillales bacterium]|nr:phenylalanine--tRNA ligase subunit beta [Rhodospirillales bacterium]